MNKIVQRLIVFFIGFPILLLAVFFLPHHNHLFLNLAIIVFSVLGAVEYRSIIRIKTLVTSIPEAVILGGACPAAVTIAVSFGITQATIPLVLVLGAFWVLTSRIFNNKDNFVSFINSTAAGIAVMIYPGLFVSFIIQMALFPKPEIVIAVFILVVFLNDAAAWLFGLLFGKGNRGIIAASPNKSIAGFIGGLVISVGTGIFAGAFFPEAFTSKIMPSVPAAALLGLCAGIAAILGDLGESAIKRSAEVKDSGTLIMGRGGALDSIDSMALAAPVYYFIYLLLFI